MAQSLSSTLPIPSRERGLCPRCGLEGDVAFDGQLLTCRPEAPGVDTGGRFVEVSPNRFRCPACGVTVRGATEG